jgi:hypothetical protein
MKLLILLSGLFLLTISADKCSDKKAGEKVYKGKLEIKGLCMNYTVRLLEGDMDTSLIVGNWIDETTQKTYRNVFALADPCKFPAGIKEGEEFYFKLDSVSKEPCIVCMAYYPTPGKKLPIKIVTK